MSPYQVQLKLPVQITKQGRRFIAWTPALDLSTSGRTESEAKKRVVLKELGWIKLQRSWMPPKVIKAHTLNITVPAMV